MQVTFKDGKDKTTQNYSIHVPLSHQAQPDSTDHSVNDVTMALTNDIITLAAINMSSKFTNRDDHLLTAQLQPWLICVTKILVFTSTLQITTETRALTDCKPLPTCERLECEVLKWYN